ncbi:hypothetical protein [Streptococcus pyogenes]|uniref:hypothetical protein n=1 Tax=Streptococcus pyogenes TaxID=1314 RepID=UPI00109D3D67|nr:hypothetical protein [Streptococcus pyogenes]VGQ81207.1 Uncharacterised protein [Streptococcus pyogenes]VHC90480.1 Uncharacterised protein [Streptococcus pyogenes]
MKLSIKTKLVISAAALALALPVGLHTYGTVTHASTYETTSLSEGKNSFRREFDQKVCIAYDHALEMANYHFGPYDKLKKEIKESKEIVSGGEKTVQAVYSALKVAERLSLSTVGDLVEKIENDYELFRFYYDNKDYGVNVEAK